MAKISDLSNQTTISDTDIIHIRSTGGVDYKVTGANLKQAVVALTTAQDIAGLKTFDDGIVAKIGTDREIHSSTVTEQTVFDALDAFVPNVGDRIICSGMLVQSGVGLTVASAWRNTTTTIVFSGIRTDSLATLTNVVTDGGSSITFTAASIAW